uniref:NADH-ubiquinone oxidoreductase chain 3 n=1 Tax=Freysuila caesalpiniae TaxID=2008487 RepID=A0A344A2C4_9HEMI|nr:NADH dehydrogenase subunit 3 [Freysuila caesalpiniae]AWU48915.1 NADH dehydrogenase subunit 3 [Freysuila caesalpiniae]
MFTMMMFMTIVTTLMLTMIMIIPLVNMHKQLKREKMSPFECGFDPFSKPRVAFSIQFFSISLMFLIFDIEMTLIMPIPLLKFKINNITWMFSSFLLIMILIMGLMLEWKEGSMNWL